MQVTLLIYRKADIVQQRGRGTGELIQEVADQLAQVVEVGGIRVKVEDVLPQPAPELFDRVEPGGIGG